MLLLVIKSRYTAPGESYGFDRFMSHSFEPVLRSDLVLYDPYENKFILFSRDFETGQRVKKVMGGSLQGKRFSETFTNEEGWTSDEALCAMVAMMQADCARQVEDHPLAVFLR